MRPFCALALVLGLAFLLIPTDVAGQEEVYRAYVAAESEDEVAVVRFAPSSGLEVERVITVGQLPAEIEGPHGIFFDPSGAYWYLTLGHGFPNGTLLKYDAATDTLVGFSELGLFPATVSLTPEGALAFIVNSNFYGDMVPSTLSVVDTETMFEIAQVETCTMPHGSRMGVNGEFNYSACMMDDQLVEVSTLTLEVTRRLNLVTGEAVAPTMAGGMDHAGMDHSGMDHGGPPSCSPTWTLPHHDGSTLFVACNRGNEIVEVDLDSWSIRRRIPAEGAPYNLDLDSEGATLLATLKGSAELGVWDLASGARVAHLESTQRVTHGVAVTHDGRYAFVTVEGIGGEPGIVEVVDLETHERVATIGIGKQAGGIALVPQP